MLVAWRERVTAEGDLVEDGSNDEDRRLLTLIPVSR